MRALATRLRTIHEAALVDYAGMWLRRTDGQRLRAQLSPSADGWKVLPISLLGAISWALSEENRLAAEGEGG